ncbi:hypothetical protein AVEN_46874-1 [Araneus ventricosus]|uniref:Uncharacterized protein n=1 Tax=Araneus ventricosus TaxID=182803 RepID=A0A4Y2CLV7_ARAVE|nr:hypothetical protein AVEN_46874-1 [Araneus ventricosus]
MEVPSIPCNGESMKANMTFGLSVCCYWSKAGHSREIKAKPFVPTTYFYSTHFSRKIRQNILGCSKVCFETRFKVAKFLSPFTPHPHTWEISSFISSLDARSQCRQIVCITATLASRSRIGINGWSFGF